MEEKKKKTFDSVLRHGIASSNCMLLMSMSCFIFFIHFFSCLPYCSSVG